MVETRDVSAEKGGESAPARNEGDAHKPPVFPILCQQSCEHELRPMQEVPRKPGCACDHTVAPAEENAASVPSQPRSASSRSQLLLTVAIPPHLEPG